MIPACPGKLRRKGATIKKYNTLIHSNSASKVILTKFTLKARKPIQRRIYQHTSQNLRWLGFFSFSFSLTSLILAYFESEKHFESHFEETSSMNLMRGVHMMLSFFHCFNLTLIHVMIEEQAYSSLALNFKNLFQNWDRFKYLLYDLIICIFHHPPGFSFSLTFTQLGFESTLSSSDLFFPFYFLKLKFIIIFIAQQSFELNHNSKLISLFFEKENNLKFILKALVYKHTFLSFILTFLASLAAFGTALRVFEKHLNLMSLYNGLWLAFTTESTVGYGEIYPKTHIGRGISGIMSILGVFVFSYSVIAVRNMASLSYDEGKMSSLIRYNVKVQKKLAPKAAELIQKFWRSLHSGKISSKFEVVELSKKFRWFRKKYLNQINLSLEDQLEESGKIMSKKLVISLKLLENVRNVESKGRKMITCSFINHRRMKYFMDRLGILDQFIEGQARKSSFFSIPDLRGFAKRKKIAVKKLFVRKVVNSPVTGKSPACSVFSIE